MTRSRDGLRGVNDLNCPECSREFPDSNKFCPYCGTRTEATSVVAATSQEKGQASNVVEGNNLSTNGYQYQAVPRYAPVQPFVQKPQGKPGSLSRTTMILVIAGAISLCVGCMLFGVGFYIPEWVKNAETNIDPVDRTGLQMLENVSDNDADYQKYLEYKDAAFVAGGIFSVIGLALLFGGIAISYKERQDLQNQQAYRSQYKNCPYCSEWILATAVKCKHCGSDLTSGNPNP